MDPMHKEILNLRLQLMDLEIKNWFEDSFLHWHWWALIAVFIFPWFLWWKLVNIKQLPWITTYGLLLGLLNCLIDIAFVNLGLYAYPHRIQPFWVGLVVGDLTIPPIIFMLIYQKYNNWKNFFCISLAAAGALSFIGEPLLKWAGLYDLYHWSYFHSLPLYLLIASIPKVITDILKKYNKTPASLVKRQKW